MVWLYNVNLVGGRWADELPPCIPFGREDEWFDCDEGLGLVVQCEPCGGQQPALARPALVACSLCTSMAMPYNTDWGCPASVGDGQVVSAEKSLSPLGEHMYIVKEKVTKYYRHSLPAGPATD